MDSAGSLSPIYPVSTTLFKGAEDARGAPKPRPAMHPGGLTPPSWEPSRSQRKSQSLQELRDNQMKCMEALRKGQRVAAVAAAAMCPNPEMGKLSGGGMLGYMSKQVSEAVSEDSISSSVLELARRHDDALAADPLVSVVKTLASRQSQAYEQLADSIVQMQQEAEAQRREMRELIRRQAREIEEIGGRAKRCRTLQVMKTLVVAFMVGFGAFHASHGLTTRAEAAKRAGVCPGASFVLAPGAPTILQEPTAGEPRRAHAPRRR